MRQPGVAGFFYPKEPDVLNATLDQFFLAPSLVDTSQIIRGIIAPHAGYMYSGQTAAFCRSSAAPAQRPLAPATAEFRPTTSGARVTHHACDMRAPV